MRIFILLIIFFSILNSCSNKNEQIVDTVNKTYDEAWELLEKKENIEAFKKFIEAKEEFLIYNDSIGAAKSLMNAAIIQINFTDYFGSEENNVLALKYFNKSKNQYLVSVYNSLAISRGSLGDYSSSILWYNKALNVSNNEDEILLIKNNIAVTLSKLNKYDEAISDLNKINILNKNVDKLQVKSKVIDNLAYIKFLQNPEYNAEPELKRALEIRENDKDFLGQNASHAHLSDYFKNKNKNKSLYHAEMMLAIAKKINIADDKVEALQKLIILDSTNNNKKYFLEYQKLNDSLQIARSKAKNQFALIRYESEENKTNFLKAQADNTLKQNQILKLYIGLIILATLIIAGIFISKRRQRINELKLKNTQLKYSKKIHDVVANDLYHMMIEIENKENLDKEILLDRLEVMYENSRDISNESFDFSLINDFSKKIGEMLTSYSSENNKVFLVGNNEEIWVDISKKACEEIYYVLRELMVNMKKHSQASMISLVFKKENKSLLIKYTDNGIGIKDSVLNNGLGFRNMENRMASIKGKINFEKNPKNGLIVNLQILI